MNRRSLLKSLAAVTAGLMLPPTLAENAEAARRFWALDRTMVATNTITIDAVAMHALGLGPGMDIRIYDLDGRSFETARIVSMQWHDERPALNLYVSLR